MVFLGARNDKREGQKLTQINKTFYSIWSGKPIPIREQQLVITLPPTNGTSTSPTPSKALLIVPVFRLARSPVSYHEFEDWAGSEPNERYIDKNFLALGLFSEHWHIWPCRKYKTIQSICEFRIGMPIVLSILI